MNKKKLSWGLILLFVGGILLLNNLDVIDFYWRSVFSMWPVLLIVIGVNLLVPRRGVGNLISIIVTVAALAFLGYRGMFPPQTSWWGDPKQGVYSENPSEAGQKRLEKSNGKFTHDYDSTITTANLAIKGGAVEYEITGLTDKLFSAEATNTIGSHQLTTTAKGSHADLLFRMMDKKKGDWKVSGRENWARIRLHPNPVWNIDLDMGAGAAEFDLTAYKIASLHFKGGAASFEAKMGMPIEETTITVESGVASVDIDIPKAAACKIVVKSGLSSRDFPGFAKQPDGSFVTEGYQENGNRFTINLQGGLSSFTVKRYAP